MSLQLWETLKEAIIVYTKLSLTTFFTVVALGLAIYYVISGLFGSSDQHHQRPRASEEQLKPLPYPIQVGEITEKELKAYDGNDPKKPLLMAIKAQIYDVSQSRLKQDVQGKKLFKDILGYWFKKVLYHQVVLVYVLTRLVTNVSQAFLAFYVINNLQMPRTSKASVLMLNLVTWHCETMSKDRPSIGYADSTKSHCMFPYHSEDCLYELKLEVLEAAKLRLEAICF